MEMEEKAEQLLAYLITKGFKPDNFIKECRGAGSQFKVEVSKSYGEELMEYQLNFSWDHQFDFYRWTGYRATYSNENGHVYSQDFIASNAGICHAKLAYNILSGRLDDVREKLWSTGIEEFTGDDVNAFLEESLNRTPDTFSFYSFKNSIEGLIEFEVKLELKSSFYEASDIQATFMRYPDIEHGIYNKVDTMDLGSRMASIDWNREGLYELDENGDLQTTDEVEKILDDMTLLLRDEGGNNAALNLQLRHWHEVPFFEGHIHADAWRLYESLPRSYFNFSVETGARKIYNLMCGRPVFSGRLTDIMAESNTWQKLVHTDQGLSLDLVEGPSRKELETFLNMLPLDDLHKTKLLTGLFNGDICKTTLYGLQQKEVIISPDLSAKSIEITTPEGAIIPYNFKLEQALEPKNVLPQSRPQHKLPTTQKKKKRKGKGI